MSLATGQSLELFVGFWHPISTHHRLDGFGQDFPCCIEILGNTGLIEFQFAQASFERGICNKAVARPHRDYAKLYYP